MSARRHYRYARRAMRVGGGRFARDDQGTVMALTIAFALPLALFLFASFNTGVGLVSRMRAQNVADASSYSSSVWQARFLNYCAYTRRHIVANYATIALTTCYVNTEKMYSNIFDADGLNPTTHQEDWVGTIKSQIAVTYYALQGMIEVVKLVREGSDHMNGYLSASQRVMYFLVGVDTTTNIMQKVVDDASGKQDTKFELEPLTTMPTSIDSIGARSYGSLLLYNMLERREIPIAEVKEYFDTYTAANCPNYISFLGRVDSPLGGWAGVCPLIPGVTHTSGFILAINIKSDPLDITNDKMSTADHIVLGTCWWSFGLYAWVYPFGIPVPIMWPPTPIIGDDTEEEYTLKNPFSDTLVYEVKDPDNPVEPSSFALVTVVQNTAPFFQYMGLLPSELLANEGRPDQPIRAFSRAKVYFRGWKEDLKNGKYHSQNLNYPFWGAKLAPLAEDTYTAISARLLLTPGSPSDSRAFTQMPEY